MPKQSFADKMPAPVTNRTKQATNQAAYNPLQELADFVQYIVDLDQNPSSILTKGQPLNDKQKLCLEGIIDHLKQSIARNFNMETVRARGGSVEYDISDIPGTLQNFGTRDRLQDCVKKSINLVIDSLQQSNDLDDGRDPIGKHFREKFPSYFECHKSNTITKDDIDAYSKELAKEAKTVGDALEKAINKEIFGQARSR